MRPDRRQTLVQIVAHAAHHLPAQGPIGVFVHHNTLHAFEDQPFDGAVLDAARTFGAQPYLPESVYRQHLASGRIGEDDVSAVLAEEQAPDDADPPLLDGRLRPSSLRRLLMRHALRREEGPSLRWLLTEGRALDALPDDIPDEHRSDLVATSTRWLRAELDAGRALGAGVSPRLSAEDNRTWQHTLRSTRTVDLKQMLAREPERAVLRALWTLAVQRVAHLPPPQQPEPTTPRLRDLLLRATGEDADELVHPLVYRLCAGFLDQGLAYWPMPHREEGLFRVFLALYSQPGGPPAAWMEGLPAALGALAEREGDSTSAALAELDALGLSEEEWEPCVEASLVAVRGFAGMIAQMEARPDRAPVRAVPASLMDLLALRLILDRFAAQHLARTHLGEAGPIDRLRRQLQARVSPPPPSTLARAWVLLQVLLYAGVSAPDLLATAPPQLAALQAQIEAFTDTDRRRIFQKAFERRYRNQILNALAAHAPRRQRPPARLQVIACIDERSESLRRQIEEQGAAYETFGTPGFFGVAMYYKALGDPHVPPLCPIAVRPQHRVVEEVDPAYARLAATQDLARRGIGLLDRSVAVGSRTLVRGTLTALLGVLAGAPMVMRVLFPGLTAATRHKAAQIGRLGLTTRLHLRRAGEAQDEAGRWVGFSVEEMGDIVGRLLEDIGLVRGFAPLVAVLGHGSGSVNNPHRSAYDCGACGGAPGGPNARAFADMANDPAVRALLAARGLDIPEATWFVGGFHNTGDDRIDLYDIEVVPPSHAAPLAELMELLHKARTLDAHERCRRFLSAPLHLSPAAALRHVEARAEDLAQARPECGHATNAIAIVGRRWRTRGLFLDRRSFLISYDPEQDEDGAILERVMASVVPVGAGINLEYWFSHVDPAVYGCGTKLPHNITAYLGVMDGHQSDLRTGLPWQMVEIHEPLRLLTIVEARPERLLALAARNPSIGRLVTHHWVQLVAWDPQSARMWRYTDAGFVPYEPVAVTLPEVERSIDWYAGRRDHLPPARVRAALEAGS